MNALKRSTGDVVIKLWKDRMDFENGRIKIVMWGPHLDTNT